MHEATIAQSILNIAVDKLNQLPEAVSVSSIKVQLGEFRNVEMDSLQFAFDNLKSSFKGCRDSQLEAEIILALAQCRDCADTYHPDFDQAFRCSKCNGGMGKLMKGEELDIVSITIETVSEEQSNYARIR
jgi:hydrogenase nickel incorporation protein HypA/HybF